MERVLAHHRLDRGYQRGEMDGNRARLRERLTARREQARGSIQTFFHDRREGAFQESKLHLVGYALELVADHLGGNGVDHLAARCAIHACSSAAGTFSNVNTSVPPASTSARQPGSTTVVVSACSTMAGPAKCVPGARRLRSYTAAITKSPDCSVRMRRRPFTGSPGAGTYRSCAPAAAGSAAAWCTVRRLTNFTAPSTLWP